MLGPWPEPDLHPLDVESPFHVGSSGEEEVKEGPPGGSFCSWTCPNWWVMGDGLGREGSCWLLRHHLLCSKRYLGQVSSPLWDSVPMPGSEAKRSDV